VSDPGNEGGRENRSGIPSRTTDRQSPVSVAVPGRSDPRRGRLRHRVWDLVSQPGTATTGRWRRTNGCRSDWSPPSSGCIWWCYVYW